MWNNSKAQKLLRKALADINNGTKEYTKPRFLYEEEEEWYDNYSLEFFRNKIYQEMKFEKRQLWLLHKYGLNTDEVVDTDKAEADS